MHGLYRALLANMVQGVTEGFTREMKLVGVGYRAQVQGNKISMSLGLSHPVEVEVPAGLTAKVDKQTDLTISGIDKVCRLPCRPALIHLAFLRETRACFCSALWERSAPSFVAFGRRNLTVARVSDMRTSRSSSRRARRANKLFLWRMRSWAVAVGLS